MKMYCSLLFLISILLITACNTNNGAIKIGPYHFDFPLGYEKIRKQGIDSEVAIIKNGTLKIQTDYGYYSNNFRFYEKDFASYFRKEKGAHQIIQDTIFNHHLRRIIIAENPELGLTGIYIKDLNSYNPSINSWKALYMHVSGITKEEQQNLLEIFKNVQFNN